MSAGGDAWDTTTNDWKLAEELHPGCSAAWDRDGGPAWTLDENGELYPNLTIHVSKERLAIGCNDRIPFRWALWTSEREEWIFVGTKRATT